MTEKVSTVKHVLNGHSQKYKKIQEDYRLMQVKRIEECSFLMQVKRNDECSLEHSSILLTCIKLPVVIKIFVLSIYEWTFYTDLTI